MANTYDKSFPTDNGIVSTEVGNLRDNFEAIETRLNRDHRFNDAALIDGYHKQVNIANQSGDASPNVSNGGVVYVNSATTGGSAQDELFYQNDDNVITQLTGIFKNSGSLLGGAPQGGYTTLPGGFLIQWGSINYVAGGVSITFADNGVAFSTAVYSLQLTSADSHGDITGAPLAAKNLSLSGFTIISSGNVAIRQVSWLAIGI